MKSWPVVSTRLLFEHPWLVLVEETLLLPSGKQTQWLRFDRVRDSVCIICLDNKGRVLVARQYNPPSQHIVGEFPGGGVEANESHADAARRELVEEVGLYPHRLALPTVW